PTVAAGAVAAGDLNGDGYPDLVFASTGQSYQFTKAGGDFAFLRAVSDIYWGSAQGYSPERVTQLSTYLARDVQIADLNNDGFPDIIFAQYGQSLDNSGALIYWGSRDGTFSAARSKLLPGFGTAAIAAVDLTGDGYPELLVANEARPLPDPEFGGSDDYPLPCYIYWGSASGYSTGHRTEIPGAGARDIKAADLNGDGRPDIVVANKV